MQIDFSSVISQYKSLTSGRNLINVIDCTNCHFSHYTANDIRISKTKKKYLILLWLRLISIFSFAGFLNRLHSCWNINRIFSKIDIVKTNILYLESFDTVLATLDCLKYFYQFLIFIVYNQMMIMHIEFVLCNFTNIWLSEICNSLP